MAYPPDQVHIAYSEYEADLCVMSTEEKRGRMLSLVEDWKASGLTQKAFGLLHGINVATKGKQIEIIYPTGVRLRVEANLALIAQLIRL